MSTHDLTCLADRPLEGRLRQTLALLHPQLMIQRGAKQTTVRPLTVPRLHNLLQAISSPLSQARKSGESANIWEIAGLGHDEVRNSRVLAWLLDPAGSHGAGDAYLQGLWQRIKGHEKTGFQLNGVQYVTRENYPIGNSEHRIDIEITGNNFLLFIEVKIHAGETKPDQVRKYAELAARKAQSLAKPHWAVLYLSEDRIVGLPNVHCLRWKDIARTIRSKVLSEDQDSFPSRLALSFAGHISRFY